MRMTIYLEKLKLFKLEGPSSVFHSFSSACISAKSSVDNPCWHHYRRQLQLGCMKSVVNIAGPWPLARSVRAGICNARKGYVSTSCCRAGWTSWCLNIGRKLHSSTTYLVLPCHQTPEKWMKQCIKGDIYPMLYSNQWHSSCNRFLKYAVPVVSNGRLLSM